MKDPNRDIYIGATIFSRDGKIKGKVVRVTNRPCFEGCRGARLSVRWEDGRTTYPCTRGLKWEGGSLRIR